jgi:hypothetical protein
LGKILWLRSALHSPALLSSARLRVWRAVHSRERTTRVNVRRLAGRSALVSMPMTVSSTRTGWRSREGVEVTSAGDAPSALKYQLVPIGWLPSSLPLAGGVVGHVVEAVVDGEFLDAGLAAVQQLLKTAVPHLGDAIEEPLEVGVADHGWLAGGAHLGEGRLKLPTGIYVAILNRVEQRLNEIPDQVGRADGAVEAPTGHMETGGEARC